jgi:hypothetical protein
MKRRWSEMRYHRDIGCWFIMEGDQMNIIWGGEWFDLYITENKSYPCQLEFKKRWVLKMGSMRLHLRTQDVYKIEV